LKKLTVCTFIICSAPVFIACNRDVQPSSPHVVLVSLDTVRADHLGCYGYFRNTTPELDRFVDECVRFEKVESASNQTLPAHASMFSSRFPREHGAVSNEFKVKPAFPLISTVLSAEGYETVGVIAAHPLNPEFGLSRDFEFYDHIEGDGPEYDHTHKRTGDEVVKRVADAIRWRERERPLFLFVHFWDSHQPYHNTDETKDLFKRDQALEEYMEKQGCNAFRINRYDGSLRALDGWLADLIDLLRKKKILDHAFLIITSDHGEAMGEHNHEYHGMTLYEEETFVPLIIRLPGAEMAGMTVPQRVSNIDIAPTIYDFLGVAGPEGMVGRSLMPLIRKQPGEESDIYMARMWNEPRKDKNTREMFVPETLAIVQGDWKLIWKLDGDNELFNLAEDPLELNNLVSQSPDKEKALLEMLMKHRDNIGPMPREAPKLSPQALKGLKALGYID